MKPSLTLERPEWWWVRNLRTPSTALTGWEVVLVQPGALERGPLIYALGFPPLCLAQQPQAEWRGPIP